MDNFSLKLQDVSQRLSVSVDREKDISAQLRQEWESRFAAKGVAFENLPPGMSLGVTSDVIMSINTVGLQPTMGATFRTLMVGDD